MTAGATFGRKRTPGAPAPSQDALRLTPQTEAFLAELKSAPPSAPADFADWSRAQRPRRLMAWMVGLALLSPGLLCFLFQAPWPVSIGLELGGIAVNGWLRRERRRYLKSVAEWTPEADPYRKL